ncbi:beclin-1 [Anaeramoeba flamelloides]|uniref:Beclin-1 n=1 Tax=Anaeramoeba flamelloides TaxID=1746091 RepID=A0AAV8A9D2_9EUKA|nr:beclin-1 [Anaeramoeba flamelloides]
MNKDKSKYCKLCKKSKKIDIIEDLDHFLWNCPAYENNRKIWRSELKKFNISNILKNNIIIIFDIIRKRDSSYLLALKATLHQLVINPKQKQSEREKQMEERMKNLDHEREQMIKVRKQMEERRNVMENELDEMKVRKTKFEDKLNELKKELDGLKLELLIFDEDFETLKIELNQAKEGGDDEKQKKIGKIILLLQSIQDQDQQIKE